MKNLREASGNVVIDDRLTAVLYLLMRDHMTCSDVDELINECCDLDGPVAYDNGFVARYAEHLAKRLRGEAPKETYEVKNI